MTPHRLLLPTLAIIAFSTAMSGPAVAQLSGTAAQRSDNAQASANMRSRIDAAIERVRVTEQHGKISRARSSAVRAELARAQAEMAAFKRRQGFVSAAQLASYDRMVVGVDAELGAGASGHASTNGARPGPDLVAFQRTHAKLHYDNAQLQYDRKGCAVYEGVTTDGKTRREPLRDRRGQLICARR